MQLRTLCGPGSMPDAAQIEERIRIEHEQDVHKPKTGLICLENAHSDGKVAPLSAMQQVHAVAQKHGVPVHLDGARLFNAAHHLGVQAKEVTQYCDTVMFCLSKGLCAPVGSILAGSSQFIWHANRNRKVMGGGMRQTGILAAAGLIALQDMAKRLPEDHRNAQLLAKGLREIKGIQINPGDVHINLVFFELDVDAEERIVKMLEENRILANPPEHGKMRLATHNGIESRDIEFVLQVMAQAMQRP